MAKIDHNESMDNTMDYEHKLNLKKENRFKRVRMFVAILSLVLFVICIYDIYVSFFSAEITIEEIKWRFRTIIRTLVSLCGYMGAILSHKRLLIATLALIIVDLILTFGVYYITYDQMSDQYEQYLQYLGSVNNRSSELTTSDCDFFKKFRRRVIENLIVVSFYVFYIDLIITFIHDQQSLSSSSVKSMILRPHPKWPLVLLSVFHLFLSIYMFWSKTFRNDKNIAIVQKKGFVYLFLWTLLAFISSMIAILCPFALLLTNLKDRFFINFLTSTVMSSIILGSAKFMIIIANEFFSQIPENDFYCNIRLTSIDNFGTILILLIINKLIITLIFSVSQEIRRELRDKEKSPKQSGGGHHKKTKKT